MEKAEHSKPPRRRLSQPLEACLEVGHGQLERTVKPGSGIARGYGWVHGAPPVSPLVFINTASSQSHSFLLSWLDMGRVKGGLADDVEKGSRPYCPYFAKYGDSPHSPIRLFRSNSWPCGAGANQVSTLSLLCVPPRLPAWGFCMNDPMETNHNWEETGKLSAVAGRVSTDCNDQQIPTGTVFRILCCQATIMTARIWSRWR